MLKITLPVRLLIMFILNTGTNIQPARIQAIWMVSHTCAICMLLIRWDIGSIDKQEEIQKKVPFEFIQNNFTALARKETL